jgi:hypothetical protein
MKKSLFKIVYTDPGLQIEVAGNLDDISHGLAEAMKNPDIKKMVAHALVIASEEGILHEGEHIKVEKVEKKPKEVKKKIIN